MGIKNKAIDVLAEQIIGAASACLENASFDRSISGRILAVLDDNKYTVRLSDGTERSVLSLTSDSFVVNDVVVVSAVQNDAKNSYIIGKPGVSKISASVGGGDMLKSVYDTNGNGIVDNAEKVNGHTVLSDVPADTVFFNYTPVNKSGDSMSGGLTAPTLTATSYFRTPSLVGEGDTSTYYHRMDAGFARHDYWAWYEYGGEYRFYINTAGTSDGAQLIGTIKAGKGWVGNVEGNVTGNASTVNNHTVDKDIPSDAVFTDTTYVDATTSVHGLMSASDKTKLDGIATGTNNYSLPVATSSILGGVKSGTDITVDSSGNVSVADNSHNHTVSNITDLTATAAELNVLDGIAASTTELNYVDGVTSNVQTQLNAKAPLASPALTGTPTAPTAPTGANTKQIATTEFVQNSLSFVGGGDMLKSVYDTNGNGIVDNAEKVSGFTVAKSVPANAVFTDTTYNNATTSKAGLESAADKTKLDTLPKITLSSTQPSSPTNGDFWLHIL